MLRVWRVGGGEEWDWRGEGWGEDLRGGGREGGRREYIFVSLDALPPEIFWTRSWPSSVLRSPSCFLRSSLLLPQRVPALTFAVDCLFVFSISVYVHFEINMVHTHHLRFFLWEIVAMEKICDINVSTRYF